MHRDVHRPRFQPSRLAKLARQVALVIAGLALTGAAGCGGGQQKPTAPPVRYAALPAKEVPGFLKNSILERVDITADQPSPVSGFGLVAGLEGTGGGPYPNPVHEYMSRQMMKHGFGSKLHPGYENAHPDVVLRSSAVAIARVDGHIPPGARKGQRFDIQVSAISPNTTSLARGTLFRADLSQNGGNARNPGVAVNLAATAEGPLFVNPAYALLSPSGHGTVSGPAPTTRAATSLRYATVLGGGVVQQDRYLLLRLRQPEFRMSRLIEQRIKLAFQSDPQPVAQAHDEGLIRLLVPPRFNGNWERFIGVATHLYFETSPGFATLKGQELAAEAVKPNAPLLDISYCWEALGSPVLPIIQPLMTHEKPDVAYAAARAAAHIGDAGAQQALVSMASSDGHPFQLTAIQTLGELPSSPSIQQLLRILLNSPQNTVRIEAYRILAATGDNSIFSTPIGSGQRAFLLDIVPTQGPPVIYATRTGVPRIAILGNKPALELPVTFAALENRLTISSLPGEKNVAIFYRSPLVDRPRPVYSRPDVAELIARLGGQGGAEIEGIRFSYGDIVAMLQQMSESKKLIGTVAGERVPVAFVLQDAPAVLDEIQNAPVIGDTPSGRPQSEEPNQVGAAQ